MSQVIFFFPFLRKFWLVCTNQKNIENTCSPPPLFLLVFLDFLFRIVFRIPFLNFLLLNLMFLVSSLSLIFFFFLLFCLVPCPLLFPLLQSLFFLVCSCYARSVCDFSRLFWCVFLFMFFFFFLLLWWVIFFSWLLFFLWLVLFCLFFFSPSLFFFAFLFFFLLLFFCCFFFLFFVLVLSLLLLLLCLEEQTAMVAFVLVALVCFRFSFFFGSSVENGPTTIQHQKLYKFLALFHPRHFSQKNLLPLVFGDSFRPFCFISSSFCTWF